MAIIKRISPLGQDTNHLAMTDGNGLCCDDATRADYETANGDAAANALANVNVTVPGGVAQTIAIPGALDWADAANDEAVIAAIGKVATDLGYEWFDGGIELTHDGDDLIVTIRDSTLVWNWIGTTTTDEQAFVATAQP